MCEDVGDHLASDSYSDAMKKLEAGFGKGRALKQHALRFQTREWTRKMLEQDRGGFEFKTEFCEVFIKRVWNDAFRTGEGESRGMPRRGVQGTRGGARRARH